MHFLLILAVLAALVVAEDAPSQPVSDAALRTVLALLGVTLVALSALALSAWTARRLRRDFQTRSPLLSLFRKLQRVHTVLWLAVAGGVLYWLEWGRLVRFNWHLDRAILVDEVLILLPVLLPMVLSWAAFYEVDRAVRAGMAAAGAPSAEPTSRRRYVVLHLRHYLGILLLPVLALLAAQDAAELLAPGILATSYGPAVCLVPITVLFIGLPSLLRGVWRTRPLAPGPLRDRLEAAAARAGMRAREILVWHTDGRVVNAAVAGCLPRLRYVFLTDGLLAQLDEEEIEAVFGHEIGHVRHRHLILRVLAMIAPLSLCLLAEQAFPEAVRHAEDWLTGGGLGVQVPMGLLTLTGIAGYALFVFGGYSRLLEAQADLFGCRALASDSEAGQAATFSAALEKLAAGNGIDRRAGTWQHGSIARRVDWLNRIAGDLARQRRFQRRVALLSRLLVAVVLSPLVYLLLVW
jgi:STE24 endopeptidase